MTPQDQLAAAIARSEQLLNPYADKRSTVQINIFDLGLILQSAHEATKARVSAKKKWPDCKCTFSQYMTGDGCDECHPENIDSAQRPAAVEVTVDALSKAERDRACTEMTKASEQIDFGNYNFAKGHIEEALEILKGRG